MCFIMGRENLNVIVYKSSFEGLTFVLFPGECRLKPGQHFSSLLLSHKLLPDAA